MNEIGRVKQLADVKYPTFYTKIYDEEMGVKEMILDFEKVGSQSIENYTQLKELLGMKLLYVEPSVYEGDVYDGLTLYFIDENGQQKILMVHADMYEPNKIELDLLK